MIFNPDLSENGKNLAKNKSIRPQNTVFCVRDNRRNKSEKGSTTILGFKCFLETWSEGPLVAQ